MQCFRPELCKIKLDTGSIHIKDVYSGEFNLSVTTGKVSVDSVTCDGDVIVGVTTGKANITDVECRNVISTGSTGDIVLTNVIASDKISINISTGDVKLEVCDAAEIFIETDTGDITGTLLSEKIFSAKSDTGKVKVPRGVTGGICEIITDTGNIKITVG